MPILAKQYKGTFVSDWQNKNATYDACLETKQTFLNVSVLFKSGESRSFSTLSTIDTTSDLNRLIYNYQNEPHAELSDRSTIHKGTVELWIEESGKLVGNYYTSRKTGGSMTFAPVVPKNENGAA